MVGDPCPMHKHFHTILGLMDAHTFVLLMCLDFAGSSATRGKQAGARWRLHRSRSGNDHAEIGPSDHFQTRHLSGQPHREGIKGLGLRV